MTVNKSLSYVLKTFLIITIAIFLVGGNLFVLSGQRAVITVSSTANIVADIVSSAVVFLIMSFILLSSSNETNNKQISIFIWLTVLSFFYIVSDEMRCFLNNIPELEKSRYAAEFATFIFGVLDSLIATYYTRQVLKSSSFFDKFLCALIICIGIANIAYAIFFRDKIFALNTDAFTAANYRRAFQTVEIVILSANIFILIFKKDINSASKLTTISFFLLPISGIAMQMVWNKISFVPSAIMLAMLIFYTNVYMERSKILTETKRDLAESRLNAMILQIDSHFVYNTLGSIASLLRTDPEQAEKMIYTFSDYLRSNLHDISTKSLIPLDEELKNLNSYITIETLRFPDIKVVYNLEYTDFLVPGMTLQPLVENAITHGIMGREQGGTLTISSFCENGFYVIRVDDDGVGFSEMKKNDGKHHIGVANVTQRLELLCDGTLVLNSIPGIGTTAEIKIPKERKK